MMTPPPTLEQLQTDQQTQREFLKGSPGDSRIPDSQVEAEQHLYILICSYFLFCWHVSSHTDHRTPRGLSSWPAFPPRATLWPMWERTEFFSNYSAWIWGKEEGRGCYRTIHIKLECHFILGKSLSGTCSWLLKSSFFCVCKSIKNSLVKLSPNPCFMKK